MTNRQKFLLKVMCKQGMSLENIKEIVPCSNSTIKRYMKEFAPKKRAIK